MEIQGARAVASFLKTPLPPAGEANESRVAVEQVSDVHALVSEGKWPYVDFAVFTPHGNTLVEKTWNSAGVLQPVEQLELKGPPSCDLWAKSYEEVFSLRRLDKYASMIRDKRRQLEEERAKATQAGRVHDCDPAAPWASVCRAFSARVSLLGSSMGPWRLHLTEHCRWWPSGLCMGSQVKLHRSWVVSRLNLWLLLMGWWAA
eukprot:1322300-Amphidinium_carterae.1